MLEFPAMKMSERSKLGMLVALHLLWGLVLRFSISKYGLGISTDSVHLLFGGMNFWAGRGLVSYDAGFLKLWPPLYPVLIGLVHGVLHVEMLTAANVLQGAAFLGVSVCVALLSLKIFPQNFGMAIALTVLSDIGAVVLVSFSTTGSDYLQLLLIALCVLLTGRYLESGSRGAFVGLAAVGLLATMNRYLGVAVLATGAVCILLMAAGGLWQRAVRAVVLGATALPAGIWLAITSRSYTRRPAISFSENFDWFSRSILQWFVEPQDVRREVNQGVMWLWIVILGLILLLFVLWRRRGEGMAAQDPGSSSLSSADAYLRPLFVFGACYVFTLFGSASLAYFNKLGGRFLLPLYVPLIALPVAAVDQILTRMRESRSKEMRLVVSVGCHAALAGVALLLLEVTMPLVMESRAEGAAGGENAYNTKAWHENPAIQYWLNHVPAAPYSLLTNQPDGVAFLAQHAASASPRRTSGPYGTEEFALDSYAAGLFPGGVEVYLVWIEPNPCPYCYGVDELRAIAQVEPLLESDAGGVYRLHPK